MLLSRVKNRLDADRLSSSVRYAMFGYSDDRRRAAGRLFFVAVPVLVSFFLTPVSAAPTAKSSHAAAHRSTAVASNVDIDARHSGYSPADLQAPLHQRWAREFGGDYGRLSYALVSGNRVFVTFEGGGGQTRVYALRASNGSTVWKASFPDYSKAWTALDGDTLYVLTRQGGLSAINADDGSRRWRRSLAGSRIYDFSSPPTAHHGVVYLTGGGQEGALYAVASNGRVRWERYNVGGDNTPAVEDGRVFVALPGPHVYGYDARSGDLKWHQGAFPHGGGPELVSAVHGHVYAENDTWPVLDARTGRMVDALYSETWPAIHGDLLVTLEDGTLHAVSRSTMVDRWAVDLGDPGWVSPPVIVGDSVFATSADGLLHALDDATGREVWSSRVVPRNEVDSGVVGRIAVGGDVLVVSARGRLVAYED